MASSTTDNFDIGPPTAPIHPPIIVDLTIKQLIDWVMVGATEAVGKEKTIWKVALCTLALLVKPPYTMLTEVTEGLS